MLLDVSALRGEGFGALEQALVQQALGHAPLGHDEVLLTRERHRHSLAVGLTECTSCGTGSAPAYAAGICRF